MRNDATWGQVPASTLAIWKDDIHEEHRQKNRIEVRGVITFNHPEINTFVLAKRLASSYGIATRRGAFCAHPYVWRLMNIPTEELEGFSECTDVNTPGMVRVSFGIYNTEAEVDEFLKILPEAIEKAREDQERYSRAEPAY